MTRWILASLALGLSLGCQDIPHPPLPSDHPGLYHLTTKTLEGDHAGFKEYQGQVTLVVNVASRCGFTPQYEGLQSLHEELKSQGFSVLGFPSNEFWSQEPGTPSEIRSFCTNEYGITFPLFEKSVTQEGEGQSPVYATLLEMTGETPGWNFCKFLVGRDGKTATFFSSRVRPDSEELRGAIEAALAQ